MYKSRSKIISKVVERLLDTEIDRIILTCLNKRKKLSVPDGQTDGLTLIIEKLCF